MENNIIDPKTLKVQSELPRIEFENQNQLEKTVDAMVERFTGLVVTKDTYKPSKEVRAEINKVIKIIDRQRIDKVNEVKKPIDDFNDRTKTLTAKLSTVSDNLGKQLNDYNDKRRAGKHEIQFAKFKQIIDEYGLQLDQVPYNPKWDNLSLAFPTFVKEAKEDGGKKTNIWNVYTKAFKEKDVTAQTWWKENHNNPDSALGNLIRQYGPFMKEKEAEKAKEAQQSK